MNTAVKSFLGIDYYESPLDDKLLVSLEPTGRLPVNVIKETAERTLHCRYETTVKDDLPACFNDYRIINTSHINKLVSLACISSNKQSVHDIVGQYVDFTSYHATLPGGFIVATRLSKPVNKETEDEGLLANSELTLSAAEERLWEHEAYRLYRNLTSLNEFNRELKQSAVNVAGRTLSTSYDVDYIDVIANRPFVTNIDNKLIRLELNDCQAGLIESSAGRIFPIVCYVPYEYYVKVRTLLDTYLEGV